MKSNGWGVFLWRVMVLVLFFHPDLQLDPLSSSLVHGLGEIRIARSDMCGRNPLISLAAAFGSGTSYNLNEVLRAVKADPVVWSQMQGLLRQYDSCIRAGEGLHFKRDFGGVGAGASSNSDLFSLPQTQSKDSLAPQIRNVFET